MKDRLVGIDINGWHDYAVRSWLKNRDGIDEPVPEGYAVDGGLLSRVVKVGDDVLTAVGGPRAQAAIHGRGPGWGDFGSEGRRVLLRHAYDQAAWGTSMRELARDPKIAVLAIPDHPGMDDREREAHIEALRSLRARRSMLVWSSVALALNQCSDGTLKAGQKLGIVELDSQGFRIQTLDLIEQDGLLTPRRRHTGQRITSSLGLTSREKIALENISSAASTPGIARALALADLPAMLSMSRPGEELKELIRLENGDWLETIGKAPEAEMDIPLADLTKGCAQIILHGPCERGLLEAIASEISHQCGAPIVIANQDAVARGAFLVALRLRQGLPPWFDYLPDIATIVQSFEDVQSLSLVESHDVAEAGKLWRSAKPVPLVWQAKSNRIEVWLKKEDDPTPRFSPAVVSTAPTKSEDVQLVLEQEPAQGRARLRIISASWPELRDRPAVVDWDAGKPDEAGRDWDTIIADFKVRPPVVPERVVLPAHKELWYPEQGVGLSRALELFDGHDYAPIYQALSVRRQVFFDRPGHPEQKRQFYAISSDGDRPDGVSDADWLRLNDILRQAEANFVAGNVKNNYTLGVLSWCFRLCPKSIAPVVAKVLKNRGGKPAFPGWQTMYPQALGRIANDTDSFRNTIEYLNAQDVPWNKNQQACAGFLLSRNDDIFLVLDQATIDRWSHATVMSLQEGLKDGFSLRHQYLPILIAGLLRWRKREPKAFTEGHDPGASTIIKLLEATVQQQRLRDKELTAFQAVLGAFRDTGTRPDLLQTLFDLL